MDTRVKPAYDEFLFETMPSNLTRHSPRKRGIQYAAASRLYR